MIELIYGSASVMDIIKKNYPTAKFVDASDFIHTERFEVHIDNVDPLDFYKLAVREQFTEICFGLQVILGLNKPKDASLIEDLFKYAKELNASLDMREEPK